MNSELKYLVKPGGILLFLVVMILVVFNFGSKQIYSLYTQTAELRETQRLLGLKVDILETVDEVLSDDIGFVDIALPSKGSVLYGMSQVKKLAVNSNVVITNMRTSLQTLEENGISKNLITFEAQGSESDLYTFFTSFYKVLPLMNLNKVSLTKTEGVTSATVSVDVFSADLPEKIPALAEGLDGFTTSDVEILNKLSQYSLPDFFEPKPFEGVDRDNPF